MITLPLQQMSRTEKLQAMEALWADLSQDDAAFESPKWHGEALKEAEAQVAAGKAKFMDWEKAKKQLRRQVK